MSAQDIERIGESLDNLYHFPKGLPSGRSEEHDEGRLALSRVESRLARLEEGLRRIAEGNLGDDPWQADYERIRSVARSLLADQDGAA